MAKMFVSLSDNTCANDVIDNDVTENDVIDSWMNMHTLLASRPNVVALGLNGALHTARPLVPCSFHWHSASTNR